jgi:hypothetical protein
MTNQLTKIICKNATDNKNFEVHFSILLNYRRWSYRPQNGHQTLLIDDSIFRILSHEIILNGLPKRDEELSYTISAKISMRDVSGINETR